MMMIMTVMMTIMMLMPAGMYMKCEADFAKTATFPANPTSSSILPLTLGKASTGGNIITKSTVSD
jgi:hypothetical protein